MVQVACSTPLRRRSWASTSIKALSTEQSRVQLVHLSTWQRHFRHKRSPWDLLQNMPIVQALYAHFYIWDS